MRTIVVVDAQTGEELPGIPTPRLIQQGRGRAFRKGRIIPGGTEVDGEVWYAVVPGRYEPATPEDGREVRVITKEEKYPWQ